MNTFWKFTSIVVIVLAVLLAVAWLNATPERFSRIAGALYGFLLASLAACWTRRRYSSKQPQ
jgi:hypothetical protein